MKLLWRVALRGSALPVSDRALLPSWYRVHVTVVVPPSMVSTAWVQVPTAKKALDVPMLYAVISTYTAAGRWSGGVPKVK